MDTRLIVFSEQAKHLVQLAAQLQRDAKALSVDLAFTDVPHHLTAVVTLATHVSEAAALRVEARGALERRAALTAEERKQAEEAFNRG